MKNILRNIKISHALIFMTIVFTFSIVGLNYRSIHNLKRTKEYIHLLKDKHFKSIILLYKIMDANTFEIVKTTNKIHNNSIGWEDGRTKIHAERDGIKQNWKMFTENLIQNDDNELILNVNSLFNKTDIVLNRLDQILANKDEAGLEEFITNDLFPSINPIKESLRILIHNQEDRIQQIGLESDDLYSSIFKNTFYFAIAIIMLSFFVAYFIISTITNTLKKANESIKKISEGDLTVKITGYGKDELGELMFNIKGLVRNLRSIMELINSAANNIAMTSHELSTNSQQISEGATEQAASVEQIAASMEEISSNIIQNSKNSNITEQISTQAGAEFESGRENIDTTVDAIQTIASKISIIGEIAFQTNILALNAAVEAARAGEHGRGFGVVAAEVGKLAERSKMAAAEINSLSISGVELSLKSKELLKIALPSINKTIKLVREISLASSEQSSGVDQINSGIQTLNHVTQQNAAASEEMATVAEELSAQAEQLTNSISFFNMGSGNQTIHKKNTAPKYLEKETKFTQARRQTAKGIDLDMRSNDDLDDEFETF